jgi:AcrR family transcriptional regulator
MATALLKRRKNETRQNLLEAAYRVFGQRGYAQATVDDVAAAAGVSKGAVYHHFQSKEELFRALLEDHGHELDAIAVAARQARSFADLVRGVVRVWIDHYRSDPLFVPLSLESRLAATREPWARETVAEFWARLRELIVGLLRIGQDSGFVRSDLDVGAAATLLFGMFDGACQQSAIDPARVPIDAVEASLVDLIERYVASKKKGDLQRLRKALAPLLEHSALRRHGATVHT